MTDKAALRRAIREEARRYSPEARRTASTQLCALIRRHSIWESARSILLFAPMADEPDISPLLTEALRDGKTLALPAFSRETGAYRALQVHDPQVDVAPGKFGILEPSPCCTPVALPALDLILVPGLAFSRNGHRLGRGKGFYDRLLAQTTATKCGVSFDWQFLTEIPHQPHDITVDYIATPSQLIAAQKPGTKAAGNGQDRRIG